MELTKRQRQIVDTLAKTGGSNKAIGKVLGISDRTVQCHMEAICKRLRVSNRVQVALWAR